MGVETEFALYTRLVTGNISRSKALDLASAIIPGLTAYLLSGAGYPTTSCPTPVAASRPPLTGLGGTIAFVDGVAAVLVAPEGSDADWSEGPPDWVAATAQAELWCRSHTRLLVGVYDAGRWHSGWIGADDALQTRIAIAAADMLERVRDRLPPPVRDTDGAAVHRLYADDDSAGEVRLTREHARAWDFLKLYRARAASISEKAAALDARLRAAIGAHRYALLPDRRRLKLAISVDRLGRSSRRLVETSR